MWEMWAAAVINAGATGWMPETFEVIIVGWARSSCQHTMSPAAGASTSI